jgi:hypothetical protein
VRRQRVALDVAVPSRRVCAVRAQKEGWIVACWCAVCCRAPWQAPRTMDDCPKNLRVLSKCLATRRRK